MKNDKFKFKKVKNYLIQYKFVIFYFFNQHYYHNPYFNKGEFCLLVIVLT